MNLTTKQESFAQHYALHGNAVGAYKAAGYSWKRMKNNVLCVKAAELLRNGKVAVRVAELQARIKDRAEKVFDITSDKILQELAAIGFVNFLDFVDVNEETGEARVDLRKIERHHGAAIGSYKVKTYPERGMDGEFESVKEIEFKLLDKKGALVELGKHVGLFKEQHKHEHNHKHEIVADAADQLDAGLDLFIARAGEEASAVETEGGDRILN